MSVPASDFDNVYVSFPTGRLTLTEIQQIFSTIPFEIDLIDRTEHFAWYSNKPNREHVRHVEELGESVDECHPAFAQPIVHKILNSFRDGSKDSVSRPLMMHGRWCLVQYYALRDVDGRYLGTIEFTGSVEHILKFYEEGAWANSDASSSASEHEEAAPVAVPVVAAAATPAPAAVAAVASQVYAVPDASTGASEHDEPAPVTAPAPTAAVAEEPDVVSGASDSGTASAGTAGTAGTGAGATGGVSAAPKAGPFTYDL